jgi:hypothetical protein
MGSLFLFVCLFVCLYVCFVCFLTSKKQQTQADMFAAELVSRICGGYSGAGVGLSASFFGFSLSVVTPPVIARVDLMAEGKLPNRRSSHFVEL